jgi:hypothetical protein
VKKKQRDKALGHGIRAFLARKVTDLHSCDFPVGRVSKRDAEEQAVGDCLEFDGQTTRLLRSRVPWPIPGASQSHHSVGKITNTFPHYHKPNHIHSRKHAKNTLQRVKMQFLK